MIVNINQLDLSKKYSYADYLTWQFDEMISERPFVGPERVLVNSLPGLEIELKELF